MNSLFVLILCLCYACCLPKVRRAIVPDLSINIRAKKAWEIIRNSKCIELSNSNNCSSLKNRFQDKMNIFMASKRDKQLSIRLINSKYKREYTSLDAFIVVDPFPDASYGHTVIFMFVKKGLSKRQCEKKHGLLYTTSGKSECMYLPDTRKCRLFTLEGPKSLCGFNYIPLVYESSDDRQRQQLSCISKIEGFGGCPEVKITPTKCPNLLCKDYVERTTKSLCHETCDFALFLSGGWNKFMNRKRHLKNIQNMWRYLTDKRGFNRDNIKVYFANNGSIDLDGDPKTKDSIPATDSNVIVDHIECVCQKRTRCIDTFILYLNGPTFPNGDMLLWDRNSDGLSSNSEILTIKELLNPLRSCGAKHFLIIADQNYGGRIIDEVKTGMLRGYKNFEKIHVVSASTEKTWSWKSTFTEKFIEYDNVYIDSRLGIATSRRISYIAKDLKKKLPHEFKVKYHAGDNSDLTITGDYNQIPGCSTNIRAKLSGPFTAT